MEAGRPRPAPHFAGGLPKGRVSTRPFLFLHIQFIMWGGESRTSGKVGGMNCEPLEAIYLQ